MRIVYVLEREDFRAAQRIAARLTRSTIRGSTGAMLLTLLIWMFLTIGALTAFHALDSDPDWANSSLFVVVGCFLAAGIAQVCCQAVFARHCRRTQETSLEPFPIEQTLEVSDQGLRFESRWGVSMYVWSAVQEVREEPGYVVLVVRPVSVVAVPGRMFGSEEGRAEFVGYVRERIGHSHVTK